MSEVFQALLQTADWKFYHCPCACHKRAEASITSSPSPPSLSSPTSRSTLSPSPCSLSPPSPCGQRASPTAPPPNKKGVVFAYKPDGLIAVDFNRGIVLIDRQTEPEVAIVDLREGRVVSLDKHKQHVSERLATPSPSQRPGQCGGGGGKDTPSSSRRQGQCGGMDTPSSSRRQGQCGSNDTPSSSRRGVGSDISTPSSVRRPGLCGGGVDTPSSGRRQGPCGTQHTGKSQPEEERVLAGLREMFSCGCVSKFRSQRLLEIKDELADVGREMETMETSEGMHNLGLADETKQNPKSNHLSIGRKKFNMDPKKGLEYLIEHGLLKNLPDEVAEFLYKGEGLSKRAIGDYLGERNDFNMNVLKDFVNLHEFSDMLIVQALRQFLWSFRLPGEAQKIDRMMECFAQRYCELNPQHFSTTDTCYVLSFAIIMLNTSLHNPCVKDKPSVDRFIDMNRGINDGKDLPPDLLTRIYDNIKKEPFKIPEDDGDDLMHTFFNPDKEGWLWKQGGRYKSWKRRWFLLKDHCLYYFEYTTDKEPKGIIPLENIQVREVADREKPNCFELYSTNNDVIKACKTNSEGKVVEGKHQVYRMSASKGEEREDWIKCIRHSIKSDTPFYTILAARRKKAQHE